MRVPRGHGRRADEHAGVRRQQHPGQAGRPPARRRRDAADVVQMPSGSRCQRIEFHRHRARDGARAERRQDVDAHRHGRLRS